MSRTYRRATPRNAGVTGPYARWYNTGDPDFPRPITIGAKVVRDGHAIRGCNGDDCDWCASNRLHATDLRRAIADEYINDFHTEDM